MNTNAVKLLLEKNPDWTLNAELAPETPAGESNLELDAELDIPRKPLSPKSFRSYTRKLGLLSKIHVEVAEKVNSIREASYGLLFREEDKYDPETPETCDILGLHLATIRLDTREQAQSAGLP
jgi:hypothetical protein